MASGRRQCHRRDQRKQDERQHGFQSDQRGEAPHRGSPDGGVRPGQRGKKAPTIHSSQDDDRDEDGELGQE